jgi:hypothetical protein
MDEQGVDQSEHCGYQIQLGDAGWNVHPGCDLTRRMVMLMWR